MESLCVQVAGLCLVLFIFVFTLILFGTKADQHLLTRYSVGNPLRMREGSSLAQRHTSFQGPAGLELWLQRS